MIVRSAVDERVGDRTRSGPKRRRGWTAALVLIVAATATVLALAARSDAAPTCTKTWIGAPGGDYAGAGNWDPVGVPAPTDWLCDSGASDRIVVNDTRTAAGATLDGELDLVGGTMTFTSTADATEIATLAQHGGTLAGAADVEVSGSAVLEYGWLEGSGSLVLGAGSVSSVGYESAGNWLVVHRPVVNAGVLSVVGSAVGFWDGSLANEGTLSFPNGEGRLRHYSGSASPVVNTGTITKTGAGSNVIEIGVSGSGGFVVDSGATLSVAADGTAASGGVSVSGGGTLALSGGVFEVTDMAVTGAGTTVATTGGTWHATGVASFGAGSGAHLSGGGLDLDGSATFAAGTDLVLDGGTLGGDGTTTVVGAPVASTVNLEYGSLEGSGSLVLGAGSVSSVGYESAGNWLVVHRPVVNAGVLSVVGSAVGFWDGSLANEGTLSFPNDEGRLRHYSGSASPVVNTGTITKTGAGSNVIEIGVSGSGGFVVDSGATLSVAADGTAASGGVSVSGGGTLALSGGVFEVTDMAVTGAGTTVATTGGTWHATGVASFGAGSGAHLSGGGLDLDGSATFAAGTDLVLDGGTLGGDGTTTVVGAPVASTVNLEYGSLEGSGSLVLGAGSVSSVGYESAGNWLVVHRPVVNAGVLSVVGSAVGFWDGSLANEGTLSFPNDEGRLRHYSGSASPVVNTGTITKTGPGTNAIEIPLDNGGIVTVSGGGELTANHAAGYDGVDTLSGGTWSAIGGSILRLSNVGVLTTTDAVLAVDGAASDIRNNVDASVLDALETITSNGGVTLRNGQALSLPGPLTTAGTVTVGATSSLTTTGLYKQTAGTTRLESATASLTATGSWVEVQGGTLGGVGTVAPELRSTGGTIAPGNSPGVLMVSGALELAANARVQVEINGAAVGTGYDRIQATGTARLAGTLAVTKAAGYDPAVGQPFDVVTGSSRTGSFSGVQAASAGTAKAFDVTYLSATTRLSVVSVPGPDVTIAAQPLGTAFNVGYPGTWRATVSNMGGASTSGTITATLTLGAGQSFTSASGTGWSCSGTSTVTCTRSGALASGATAPAIDLTVGVTAPALPTTTLTTSVSGGGDTRPGNNGFSTSVAVKNLIPPNANLQVTPTKGTVPLSVTADSGLSTGSIDSRSIDWGDGTSSSSIVSSHTYTQPGTYTVSLRVDNEVQSDSATQRVVAVENVPLVADAGDDRVAAPGLQLQFDGGNSTPANAIDTYAWNFGDGNSAGPSANATAFHAYAAAGAYDATLSVTRGVEVAHHSVKVTVKAPVGTGLVVDVDSAGSPVPGADVTVIDGKGNRYSDVASLGGVATLRGLPDGSYTVYAYAVGYVPGVGHATVDEGNGSLTIDLASGSMATSELVSRRMSYDEILAAGIDPNDPANQHVVEFELCLAFGDYTCIEFSGIGNGEGELLKDPFLGDPGGGGGGGGGGGVGTCTSTLCSYDLPDGTAVTAQLGRAGGQPSALVMRIPGRAKWLKEFFDVSMAVVNLAPAGFTFEEGVATLDLPEGLTLAPTGDPQSLDFEMDDVPGGESRTANWIVRGDVEGEYHLTAAYSGVLDPLGKSVHLEATTATPLKVWGLSAVEMLVTADDAAVAHEPYRFTLTLTNVTSGSIDPATVYNPVLAIDESAGGTNYIVQPDERYEQGVDELAPGESFSADFVVIPTFSGPLNVAGSAVFWAAGEDAPATTIVSQPRLDALDVTPSQQPAAVRLDWEPTPGAVSYRIHRTPTDLTKFPVPAQPLATVAAPATTATVPAPPGPQWYAVSSIDANGVATTRHVLVQEEPLPPPPMNLSVADASVVEGDHGKPRSVQFAVTLSEPATSEVTVGYTLLPGSATTADFNNNKGATKTLRIKPAVATGKSNTVYYVTAKVTPDLEVEGNQAFTVVLSNPTGGFGLGSPTATATILDDDPGSGTRVSVGDASIWEGDIGKSVKAVGNAKVWVSLSAPATQTVTVRVDVTPGTASVGPDYKAFKPKTLTFKPGESQKSISVGTFPETAVEGDETVTVTLSNPTGGVVLGRSGGTITIRNDD